MKDRYAQANSPNIATRSEVWAPEALHSNEVLSLLTDLASLSVHPLSPHPTLAAWVASVRFRPARPLVSGWVRLDSWVPSTALSTYDVWQVARSQREARSNGLMDQRLLPSLVDRRHREPTALGRMGSECMG
jgi:hypothetical protein